MSKISSRCRSVAGALGLAALATALMAQAPAGQSDEQGQPGYAMMYGYPGGVPWMMEGAGAGPGMMRGAGGPSTGWGGGGPGFPISDRLSALKEELHITASETDAWNSYAEAVTSTHSTMRDEMQTLWQYDDNWGPEQRIDAMDKMVALMKQGYGQEKRAADALMPHLSPFQQGQAKEILPGFAAGGCGPGMWGVGMGWGPAAGGMIGW